MFIEFKKADISGWATGPIWINTNSVWSVEPHNDKCTLISHGKGKVYVQGDVLTTLSRLNEGN
jgi:hypothetical protein